MTYHTIPPTQNSPPSAELELASRSDASQLGQLQAELAATLQGLRFFGKADNSPAVRNAEWHGHWDDISQILARIVSVVGTMTAFVEASESGSQTHALEAWDLIQVEDDRLVQALKAVRTQVGQFSVDDRKEWNVLARALESQLGEIHACAQSLRLKLEELRERSDGAPLAGGAALPHDHDFRQAALKLEREKHEFLGSIDVIKGLSMWLETPDKRMRENRSLVVTEA